MKKLGIGIAAAVAVLAAGGATTGYLVGNRIEEGFATAAKEWSKPPLLVQVQDYQKGIFSSTAHTLWTVDTGEEKLQFTAQHDISHGPLPIAHLAEIVSTFAINPDAPPEWVVAFKDKAPLVWKSKVGWSKSTQNEVTSPAFNGEFGGDKLAFGGFKSDFEMSSDFSRIKGDASMPSLLVQPKPGEEDDGQTADMLMSGNTMRFDMHQPKGQEFMVGSIEWALASLKLTPKSGEGPAELADLKLAADTQLQGEVVNTSINTSIKSFVQKDHKIDDMVMDLGLHNLDAGWLNQFTKESQKTQGDPQAMQMLLMQGMQQLLARKPELEVKRISWRTAEGTAEVAASLSYQGDAAKPLNPMTDFKALLRLDMPKPVLQSLYASKVRETYVLENEGSDDIDDKQIDSAVQQDVDARLAGLVDAGLLVDNKDRMASELQWADGKLQANGKPLDQNGMMGLLSAMP
ncbi:YdgA family protein [Comamonas sp.]|uniref:YdgA family protein n=1 Tax=Comamonas sp. TaxID=34028 RepID=UPI00289D452B|nr:YdgA family protein [Comamonas sp.]